MASEHLKRTEVTIRKRVECEERAFHIVNKLVDGCVDDEYFSECGKRISQENYDDIVEERSIVNLCGYSLCHESLPNVPKKKYHISTKANKVYDISERKKFCSNQCFKASNNFKQQIPETPVWARDKDKIEILISPHKGVPGQVGHEVIGPVPKKDLKRELEELEELDKRFVEKDTSTRADKPVLKECKYKGTKFTGNEAEKITTKNSIASDNELVKSNSHDREYNDIEDIQSDFVKLGFSSLEPDQTTSSKLHEFNSTSQNTESFKSLNSNKIPASKMESSERKLPETSSMLEQLQKLLNKRKNVLSGMVDLQENKDSSKKSVGGKCQNVEKAADPNNKSVRKRETPTAKVQSPLCIICQVLKRWVSIGTVEYLQFKTPSSPSVENATKKFSDLQIQVDCVSLSKNLDLQEKQIGNILGGDAGGDGDAEDDVGNKEKKNVPDYNVLKNEAEEFQLKVTEFITGKKPKQETKEKTDDSESGVYIPTVDAYDQSHIRAKIVLERLEKSLPDLLFPMGLSIQNVSSHIRELVYTFKLERDTIIFKPAEWTLVSLILLKMLSFRVKLVQEAFVKDSTGRHFSVLLKGIKHSVEDIDMYTRDVLSEATVVFEPS